MGVSLICLRLHRISERMKNGKPFTPQTFGDCSCTHCLREEGSRYKGGIMTQIKICGFTDPKEAAFISYPDVSYMGMVLFFEKSKRNISLETAKAIMRAADLRIQKVAVVVSSTGKCLLKRNGRSHGFSRAASRQPMQERRFSSSIPMSSTYPQAWSIQTGRGRIRRRLRNL